MTAAATPSPSSNDASETGPQESGEALQPGQLWSYAEESEPVEEISSVAQEAKQGLAAQSDTLGALIETLDSWALEVASIRISVFDVLFLLASIGLVIVVAWTLTRIARSVLRNRTGLDEAQKVLAEKLLTVLIWTLAVLVSVDLAGIDLTALAFFGGAFGLAIGFGLQKTFGNLISGILLLLDKSIKPGDVISVTDQAGNEAVGQIRKIGIRAISVITRDQTEHLIPNENLMVNQVVNWSYSSKDVRVKAPVGVSYSSDLDLVERLLYQAVEDAPRILKRPKPRVNLMEFGDNSVNFDVRFWIEDPEEGLVNIRSDVYKRMWQLFKENDIEIPFPQRDFHLRSSDQLERLIEMMEARQS